MNVLMATAVVGLTQATAAALAASPPQRPIPGNPNQPGLRPVPPPDSTMVVIPIAVVSACLLLLCLAYFVQSWCGGSSVKRGPSMNPAKDGWFAKEGRHRSDYLLDRWQEGLELEGDDRPHGVTAEQRQTIDERGGPAVAYRFVPNADIGQLRDSEAPGEEAQQRVLFDINDPFDDVFSWGGVSVHEGKSITFRKWSERSAIGESKARNVTV